MSPLEAQALVISLVLTVIIGVVFWTYESASVGTAGGDGARDARPAEARVPQGDYRPRGAYRPKARYRAADAHRSLAVVPIVVLLLGVLWWS